MHGSPNLDLLRQPNIFLARGHIRRAAADSNAGTISPRTPPPELELDRQPKVSDGGIFNIMSGQQQQLMALYLARAQVASDS
jgi:hypothetical protein